MQERKHCQYCGSNDLEIGEIFCPAVISSKQKYVQCKECGACGPLAINDELAILKWNNRIQEAPELPPERPNKIYNGDKGSMYCPFGEGRFSSCYGNQCMMWVVDNDNKGRCGLVNTIYGTTGCGAV